MEKVCLLPILDWLVTAAGWWLKYQVRSSKNPRMKNQPINYGSRSAFEGTDIKEYQS